MYNLNVMYNVDVMCLHEKPVTTNQKNTCQDILCEWANV